MSEAGGTVPPLSAKTDKQVILYSMPNCDVCDIVKRYFAIRGVAYTEKNVKSNDEIAEEAKQKAQTHVVPVLDIGGHIIVGFDQRRIDTALFA